MTELDDLVGNDLEPGERARLARVHALLEQAGPPPELPPVAEPRLAMVPPHLDGMPPPIAFHARLIGPRGADGRVRQAALS